MKILVVNAGSSSLKYQLIDMQTEKVLAKGGCERIGIRGAFLKAKGNGGEKIYKQSMPDHKEAIRLVLDALMDEEIGVIKSMKEIDAVGSVWWSEDLPLGSSLLPHYVFWVPQF